MFSSAMASPLVKNPPYFFCFLSPSHQRPKIKLCHKNTFLFSSLDIYNEVYKNSYLSFCKRFISLSILVGKVHQKDHTRREYGLI